MSADIRDQLQRSLGAAYTLERELGGTGLSHAFVARDTSLGRTVVVKTLPPALGSMIDGSRFAREVRMVARLQHANIVPVLASGDANGTPYVTMPFVDGTSLRQRLLEGAMPAGEALQILRDTAKALASAHAQGVVHRNLKPDNVLLSGGTAMVADFGIASALLSAMRARAGSAAGEGALPVITSGTVDEYGTILGTPAYAAPEQARSDVATDHRADLYAWGALAYELLGGEPLFGDRVTVDALLTAHATESPRALRTVQPRLSAGLAGIVMRCLEKDPTRRPQSAAEVLLGLDNANTPGANMPKPAAPPPATTALPARAIMIVVVALVLIGLALTWVQRRRAAPGGVVHTRSIEPAASVLAVALAATLRRGPATAHGA